MDNRRRKIKRRRVQRRVSHGQIIHDAIGAAVLTNYIKTGKLL